MSYASEAQLIAGSKTRGKTYERSVDGQETPLIAVAIAVQEQGNVPNTG